MTLKAWKLVPGEDQHQVAAGLIRVESDPNGRLTLGLDPPQPARPLQRARPVPPLWSIPCAAYEGSIRTGDVLLVLAAEPLDRTRPGSFQLLALKTADGSKLWSRELPSAPARHGLTLDNQGRILVTLDEGRALCWAQQ